MNKQIIFLATAVAFLFLISTAHAQELDSWWNSSWQYRKPININVSDGSTLTDFQVLINVTYESGMQSDFDDLRFTNNCSDDAYEISYCLGSLCGHPYTKVDGQYVDIWVKVPAINSTICMYYGNSEVTTTSDAFNTFEMFADFSNCTDGDDGSCQGFQHINYGEKGYGNVTTDNEEKVFKINTIGDNSLWGTTFNAPYAYLTNVPTGNFIAQARIYSDRNEYSDGGFLFVRQDSDDWLRKGMGESTGTSNWTQFAWDDAGTSSHDSPANNTSPLYVKIIKNGNNWSAYDSSNGWSWRYHYSHDKTMTVNDIGFGAYESNAGYSEDYYFDDLIVRKYHGTEPTYAVGSEQARDTSIPVVTLVSPTNGYTASQVTVTFNCTATDDENLVNITLWHNGTGTWSANETVSVSGTYAEATFTKTFNYGDTIIWNCIAYDNDSQSDWGNSNYTFHINYPAPTITLLSPENGTYQNAPINFTYDLEYYGSVEKAELMIKLENSTNFTIIVLPDTQRYSQSYPQIFDNQTKWIVEKRNSMNIVFVIHEGDIVNNDDTNQWNNANKSMYYLDDAGVPYAIVGGNHDTSPENDNGPPYTTTSYDSYFPPSRFSSYSWYQGWNDSDSENTTTNWNNYNFFNASGLKFMAIGLSWCPSDSGLDWANRTISQNPDKRVIYWTHQYMNIDDSRVGDGTNDVYTCSYSNSNGYDGEDQWNRMVKYHKNIFMVLSGHVAGAANPIENVGYLRSQGVYGNNVDQMLANYQKVTNGGNGYLRILTFSPAENRVYVDTYSPYLNAWENTTKNQFSFDYDMTGWIPIATNSTPLINGTNWIEYNFVNYSLPQNFTWNIRITQDGQTYLADTNRTVRATLQESSGDTTPPSITIYSPENITYNIQTINLEVSANETIDTWWYSLNGGANTTFTPNATITVPEGLNHLEVYANDSAGNMGSSEVYFTYSSPPSTQQTLMQAHPELIILPLAIIGASLYVIFSVITSREISFRALISILLFALLLVITIGFIFTVPI